MEVRISQWGNSIGVRIPAQVAAEVGLAPGSDARLTVENGVVRIEPLRRHRYLLEELLAGITAENLHPEVDAGPDVGREAID